MVEGRGEVGDLQGGLKLERRVGEVQQSSA